MFKSFILDYLVSLLMKIMNSVVVVGLYYGFLTTFSIGPSSYLFLLRAGVMEEGTEKKVAATTGFLTGQLIMFISIYYAPLHLALGRPHTITVIALPYLFFHFFCNRPQYYGDIRKNTLMRNLSIQMIFLNNLLFQLLNLFILPSSILVRVINISLFRSNNKILFLTSSLVSWLIGQILFIKSVGFLLDWIQQNNYIQKILFKRSKKYIMYQVRYYMPRIWTILLCIICLSELGRTPVPIMNPYFHKKVKKISEPEEKERGQIEEQQEQNRSAEEDSSPYLFSEENKGSYKIDETEKKEIEKPLVTTLFDYNQWYRPLRYIKNDRFENDIKNEMSQYFFYTCQSDGKERISFTYPPSLSTFVETMQKKMSLFTKEKISYDELYNCWTSTNEQKKDNLSYKFLNRFKVLDKRFLNRLEKRSRLSNDKTKKKYLPRIYDPLLNGSYRGQIKNEIYIKSEETQKKLKFLFKKFKFLFDKTITDPFDKTITDPFDKTITDPKDKTIVNRNKSIEINKKVPRWVYRLIDEFEEMEGEREEIEKEEEEKEEEIEKEEEEKEEEIEIEKEEEEEEEEKEENETVNWDPDIRTREYRRIVIFTDEISKSNGEYEEIFLIDYPPQPDFRRELIKGSMRAQRRKTVIGQFLQSKPHSLLFLDQVANLFEILFDDVLEPLFFIFQIWTGQKVDQARELASLNRWKQLEELKKEEELEKRRIKISEDWDNIHFGQAIRSCLLVTQSIFRKYIRGPLLIITKNIVRILLFQTAEWSEDFTDWKRELHIRCTYNGIPFSETEFPKKWLTEGMHIKILYPFRLKPWHKSKPKKHQKIPKMDFCFLTVLGTETALPFGAASPRKRFDFFNIIFKEIGKRMQKRKKNVFLGFKMKNERTKWIIKKILFVKEIIKKLKKIFLFGLRQRYELSETQKDSTIINSNQMIYESSISIQSINWTDDSLTTEEKIKDLNDRINRIINEIDKSPNDKKKGFILPEINISSNKATYNNKRLDLQKNIWQLLKRKTVRLVRKSHYFLKFFIERAYIDIFLCISNISRINIQLFLESTKEKINKYISNNKANEERINKSIIHFCSTIQKSICTKISKISNTNSQVVFDVSSLSQAYVFYKLSQNPIFNSYKHRVRSFLQNDELSPFVMDEILDNIKEVVLHSKLIRPHSSVTNQWLNWLNVHYQYNLSYKKWSRLVPKKWRNRINKRGMAQNKDLIKWDSSYEKNRFYKKQEQESLLKIKKFKKQHGYDFLAIKSLNSANKKDSLCWNSETTLQVGDALENHRFYGMSKQKLFDNLAFRNFIEDFIYIENTQNTGEISIQNYLGDISHMEKMKNMDRKYFDWGIMNFDRINKMDMEGWVNNDYYLTSRDGKEIYPSDEKKRFFDWMGMNVEIINYSIFISIPNRWFFSKYWLFYNEYRSNPWVIPIKLLFSNFNGNINPKFSENKSITKKKKLELETRNQRETENAGRVALESSFSTQETDFEKDVEWDMKKENRKQKKYKIEEELDFFLTRYWGFQLNWVEDVDEKVTSNLKLSGLVLKAEKNLELILLGYLQRKDLNLDTLGTIKKDESVVDNGLLVIEPIRMFRKNDGKFIMYQTIGPSLIHKNKRQIHQNAQKEREKSYNFYSHINNFDEDTIRHHKMTENKEQKYYDLLVPENILSSRRRRELRILMCLTYRNRNTAFYNEDKVKNRCQVLGKSNEDRDKEKQIFFKFFLWPNYRLEDLACMNRYWFDSNNGSRFSMLRIHMYPRLKIR
uniref:Protein TIC 214 n=1 Tax=Phanera carcinophylla TaxID=228513 RepID=A0AAT9ZW60_9FABA